MYQYLSSLKDERTGAAAELAAIGIEAEDFDYTPQYLLDYGHEMPTDEYFDAVRQLALSNSEEILERWLPEGELRGREYKAYNRLRQDSSLGSFSINVDSGCWADFATDDKGGDLISLVQFIDELEFSTAAARQVLKFVAGQATLNKEQSSRVKKVKKAPELIPVMPIPEVAFAKRANFFGAELGKPVAEWAYKDAEGRPVLYVLRFDLSDGKQYRPYTYCVDSSGAGSWRLKAPATNRPAYGLDRLAANPKAVVIFAEGEKAADACQRFFPECVAVTTMHGAKSPSKTDFSPFAGRRVLIAPDYDEAGVAYKDKLVELLRGVGARVAGYMRMEALSKEGQTQPAGYDLADAEADGWTREKLEAIKDRLWMMVPQPERDPDSKTLKPDTTNVTTPSVAGPDQKSGDSAQSTVKAMTGKMARKEKEAVADPHVSAFNDPANSPNSPAELQKFCGQRQRKPTVQEWAQLFVKLKYQGHMAYFSNQVVAYTEGYWKALNVDLEIKKGLMTLLGNTATPSAIKSILETLQILYAEDAQKFERHSGLICVANGTLDPVAGALLDHAPEYCLTNRLEIAFDANAACPIWERTLDEIFQPDADKAAKIALLQEFFGYCLIPDTRLHQFLWMVGGGGNGKSLVLSVLTAIIGQENISYAQIERFQEKFVRAELQGKLLNISSEMSAQATVSDSYLKQITSGDIIEAERKFQPSFKFRSYCRIIAATNILPRLLDHTEGFFRRAMILRFNRQFKGSEIDPQREMKLMAELPGILNWAVAGLKRLLERGHYEIPASSIQELESYRMNSDPLLQFATEHLTQNSDRAHWIGSNALYQHYDEWCRRCGYRSLAIAQFVERLKTIGFRNTRTNRGAFWEAAYSAPEECLLTEPGISPLASQYQV